MPLNRVYALAGEVICPTNTVICLDQPTKLGGAWAEIWVQSVLTMMESPERGLSNGGVVLIGSGCALDCLDEIPLRHLDRPAMTWRWARSCISSRAISPISKCGESTQWASLLCSSGERSATRCLPWRWDPDPAGTTSVSQKLRGRPSPLVAMEAKASSCVMGTSCINRASLK